MGWNNMYHLARQFQSKQPHCPWSASFPNCLLSNQKFLNLFFFTNFLLSDKVLKMNTSNIIQLAQGLDKIWYPYLRLGVYSSSDAFPNELHQNSTVSFTTLNCCDKNVTSCIRNKSNLELKHAKFL